MTRSRPYTLFFYFLLSIFVPQLAWTTSSTSSTLSPSSASATSSTLTWWTTTSHPFRGITWIHLKTLKPRLLSAQIVKVDLTDPGIRFTVSGPNGPKVKGETTVETTRAFARRVDAQVAINASFFTIATTPYVDNFGLTVSDGNRYSSFTLTQPALAIGRDNTTRIVVHDPKDKTGYGTRPRMKVWNAVGGNERILLGGANVARDKKLHPRTAAGVSADGKTLILLVADGRNPLHSLGMTTIEAADFLKRYGAAEAINLDGGGSSTLVVADPKPRVVNVTVGIKNIPFTERRVGTNLGIYAAPAE